MSRLTRRLNENHRAVVGWTLLCAAGASFGLAMQAMRGVLG